MKKKRTFLSAFPIFLFLFQPGFAQITFQKTYGIASVEDAYGEQTSDGGYVIVGSTTLGTGPSDIYLIKTDVNGDTLWTKTFGGTNSEFANSVQQLQDKGYIIGGQTNGFVSGTIKCYLVRVDSIGNLLWSKVYKDQFFEDIFSVIQTTDNGFIMAGICSPQDFLLIKTNASGDTLWTRAYGGTSGDAAFCIRQTNDSGYIIVGRTQSFGAGSFDVLLVKINSTGDLLWAKTYGGSADDVGQFVHQTFDGGYIIAGWTGSFGSGFGGVYLIKTDLNGDTLWTKTFENTGTSLGYSAQQISDSGYVVVGYSNMTAGNWDIYFIRTNANGNMLWSKSYGGTGYNKGTSVSQTSDGGFVISGTNQNGGIYLIKTDASGNSFCNETNAVTIENSTSTQITSPTVTIGFTNTTIVNPGTMIGNGGLVTTFCFTVGTNEIADKENPFSIFPNPFYNKISFHPLNVKNEKILIRIFNEMGEKIFERQTLLNDQQIDLSSLSRGIYLLNIKSETLFVTKKIVKL